jgi:hypothetical protein
MAFLAASQLDESNAFLQARNHRPFTLVSTAGLVRLFVIGAATYSTNNPRRQNPLTLKSWALNDQSVPSRHGLLIQGRRIPEQKCEVIRVATVAMRLQILCQVAVPTGGGFHLPPKHGSRVTSWRSPSDSQMPL